MSQKNKLKYLFIAEFTDGSTITQTAEDRSVLEPEKRSRFYDVLQSKKTLSKFSLVENKIFGMGNVISVDLKTGLFEVNGLKVLLESTKLPTLPEKFDLIFYRQHTQNINVTYGLQKGEIHKMEEGSHSCEYFIGWQCNIKGKNYQQKIAVA